MELKQQDNKLNLCIDGIILVMEIIYNIAIIFLIMMTID